MTAVLEHVPEMSLAQRVAMLPKAEQEEILAELPQEELLYDSGFWLRPSQLLPITRGDTWDLGIAMAGRGWGKTRVLAEWVRHKVLTLPAGSRGALVARTAADVRDVLVNGISGIVACCTPDERPLWEPSKRLLTFPNGTSMLAFSSEAPDQLRGPQFHFAIADEIASWLYLPDESGLTAWDNLRLATRLGEAPQILAGTTPRRTPFMKALMKRAGDARTLMIHGSTRDNELNLARAYLEVVYGLYGGTRLAQQELDGQLLEDAENALWTQDLIDSTRLLEAPEHALRIVAVDPSVADKPRDECGIVVMGGTAERALEKRQVYVLEDASLHGSPAKWAQRVVDMAAKWMVRTVVAEGNQGGELVANAIRTLDPNLRVEIVHARVDKRTRAEPVALMYEQGRGRIHHVGVFPELESQQTTWDPSDPKSKSPDRMDALVWGATALAIKPPSGLLGGVLRSSGAAAHRQLPAIRVPVLGGLNAGGLGNGGATASGGYAATVLAGGGLSVTGRSRRMGVVRGRRG